MLKVGIEYGDGRSAARQNPVDASAGQAAPSDAADATNPIVDLRKRLCDLTRPIRRIVVNKYRFPSGSVEGLMELPDDEPHIGGFIERGNDDRKLDGFASGVPATASFGTLASARCPSALT